MPESLTIKELRAKLARIEEPFAILEQELRLARDLWQAGDDGGREGVIYAVEAVCDFLRGFKRFDKDRLTGPLEILVEELDELKHGIVTPLLASKPSQNHPPDSLRRKVIRGFAAGAMELLMQCPNHSGDKSKTEWAATCVKNELVRLRVMRRGGEGKLSQKTVIGWRKMVRSKNADEVAASTYRYFVSSTEQAPPDPKSAERHILEALSGWVKSFRADG